MERFKSIFKEWIGYAIVFVLVLLVKNYIVTPIKVNGPSMNDTLRDGDIMLLNEINYKFNDIERFDIVVIKYRDEYIIKRVIGLPGEVVSYKDDKLYINGKYIKEDFDHKKTEDFKEITVGEGYYFVLGDNRVNSTDSRIIGPINKKNIKGRARVVLFPFKRFGSRN